MKKDELLEKIARYKEKNAQCEHKLEIIRRKVVGLDVPLYPEQFDKYCNETDFIFQKLDEEMVIIDYLVNSYMNYIKKEGL